MNSWNFKFKFKIKIDLSLLPMRKLIWGQWAIALCFDSSDKSGKHTGMNDKQMHQITPKLTLNATRSKPPHLCFINVTESKISLRLALRPAIFKVQASNDRERTRFFKIWHFSYMAIRHKPNFVAVKQKVGPMYLFFHTCTMQLCWFRNPADSLLPAGQAKMIMQTNQGSGKKINPQHKGARQKKYLCINTYSGLAIQIYFLSLSNTKST